MVDALREAQRVLKPCAVLIDVRPVTAPMAVEVVIGARATWAKLVPSSSTPEDVVAADVAVQRALSLEWFVFDKSIPYEMEIYCDTAVDFSHYAQNHKLPESEIPYQELQERLSEVSKRGQKARLRFRRPWMLSVYRKT